MTNEKLTSLILSILGTVIIVDTFLVQTFNIGTKQESLTIGYCIAFVLFSIKFPKITKKKTVLIPLYILIAQMLYSFIKTYIL